MFRRNTLADESDDFLCEHQMVLEVGRIEHQDQHFGRPRREFAVNDLRVTLFVRAGGSKE